MGVMPASVHHPWETGGKWQSALLFDSQSIDIGPEGEGGGIDILPQDAQNTCGCSETSYHPHRRHFGQDSGDPGRSDGLLEGQFGELVELPTPGYGLACCLFCI